MLNEILKLPSTSSPKRSSTAASSPEDLYRPVPQAVLGRVLLPCLADGPTRVLASSRTSAAASLASPPSSELGMEQDLAELRELKTADQCLQVELATLPVTQACVAASKLPGEPGRFLWSSALPSATPPYKESPRQTCSPGGFFFGAVSFALYLRLRVTSDVEDVCWRRFAGASRVLGINCGTVWAYSDQPGADAAVAVPFPRSCP